MIEDKIKSLRIIDTHLHLWDVDLFGYPWLSELPAINQTYLVEDYSKATTAYSIEKMVFVQCECQQEQYLDEVKWVSQQAMRDPRIQGIVSFFPVEELEERMLELEWLEDQPLVKGVRRQYGHDLLLCLTPAFIEGVQELARHQLSFDICIEEGQLQETVKMVEKCPDVHFILDHACKPNIAKGKMDPWKSYMAALAEMPHVTCKVSGLITEAGGPGWKKGDLYPYLEEVFDLFGFERTIFGGDWPVVLLAGKYTEWMDALVSFLSLASKDDLDKLFYKNAQSVYRL